MGGSSNSATDSTASIIIVPGEGIARVLDLGAGRGFWSLLVSQELRNRSGAAEVAEVVAVDANCHWCFQRAIKLDFPACIATGEASRLGGHSFTMKGWAAGIPRSIVTSRCEKEGSRRQDQSFNRQVLYFYWCGRPAGRRWHFKHWKFSRATWWRTLGRALAARRQAAPSSRAWSQTSHWCPP